MSTPARPLRRDAQRNHDLLVQAARDVFAAKGLDAPLDEIARRAGVSPGTLYHRFATREALIEAAMQEHVEQAVAMAQEAYDLAPASRHYLRSPPAVSYSELTSCSRNTNHHAALQAFAIFTFTLCSTWFVMTRNRSACCS